MSATLVIQLAQLKAKEAAKAIKQAFADERVDTSMIDWENVEEALELVPPEEIARRVAKRAEAFARFLPPFEGRGASSQSPSDTAQIVHRPAPLPSSHSRGGGGKKAKNKMAKQSRKKNRKR